MGMTRAMERAAATDRLSELPECLLSNEILPKISFREAIRCSLLSRIWRFLSTKMPQLNFCSEDFENKKDQTIQVIINNALLRHSPPIHSFWLQIALTDYTSLNWVGNWVRLAALKQVKRIGLQISLRNPRNGKKLNGFMMFLLGDSVFECESLIALKVHSCILHRFPATFGGFQSLKTCEWFNVRGLNDTIFTQFMELCPNLKNLGVLVCPELRHLKINAPNLRYLYVGFFMAAKSMNLVCPQLTEIKLAQYRSDHGLQLLNGVLRAESVEKITFINYGGVNQEIPNFAVLDRFPRLQELTIHGQCFQEMISVNKVPEGVTLPNLKKVHVHFGPQMDEKKLILLGFLLRNCLLNAMRVFLHPRCPKTIQNMLLDLKKVFPELRISTAKIRWIDNGPEVCKICDTLTEYL